MKKDPFLCSAWFNPFSELTAEGRFWLPCPPVCALLFNTNALTKKARKKRVACFLISGLFMFITIILIGNRFPENLNFSLHFRGQLFNKLCIV